MKKATVYDTLLLLKKSPDSISCRLIRWYEANKRELPWRETQDPYRIWISEIILQQTRVAQGLDYYLRFIERFPDISSLASAEEEEVLKYWQGLGYYSRARNLHASAKIITQNFGGIFPNDYKDILQLKGIGEYTAAAITSFAWNQHYPVVDGNVFRFLSRLLSIDEPIDTLRGKKLFTDIAGQLMDPSQPGLFNQAIMEFGALHCIPSTPDCGNCPFRPDCIAYLISGVEDYPVKSVKTKVQTRYLYYFHIRYGEHTYLSKRSKNGIWKNLYEFPVIESEIPFSFSELSTKEEFQNLFLNTETLDFHIVIENKKHVLSHRLLFATFYEVSITGQKTSPTHFYKVREDRIHDYPTHRLMLFYLDSISQP